MKHRHVYTKNYSCCTSRTILNISNSHPMKESNLGRRKLMDNWNEIMLFIQTLLSRASLPARYAVAVSCTVFGGRFCNRLFECILFWLVPLQEKVEFSVIVCFFFCFFVCLFVCFCIRYHMARTLRPRPLKTLVK